MKNQDNVPAFYSQGYASVMKASSHCGSEPQEPAVRTLIRHARKMISQFEGAVWACRLAVGFALLTAFGPAAAAADITCSPTEVAVYPNRVHVVCSANQTDGGSTILYWAVPSSDAHLANRFMAIASTALVSGRTLVLRYLPGDLSGQSFGCLSQDCRQVIMFGVR